MFFQCSLFTCFLPNVSAVLNLDCFWKAVLKAFLISLELLSSLLRMLKKLPAIFLHPSKMKARVTKNEVLYPTQCGAYYFTLHPYNIFFNFYEESILITTCLAQWTVCVHTKHIFRNAVGYAFQSNSQGQTLSCIFLDKEKYPSSSHELSLNCLKA